MLRYTKIARLFEGLQGPFIFHALSKLIVVTFSKPFSYSDGFRAKYYSCPLEKDLYVSELYVL